jgi:hypothetical protein
MKEDAKTAGWKAAAWLIFKSVEINKKTKLAFYRELRSLGVLPEEATFFLIGWHLTKDVSDRYDAHPEIRRVQEEMDAIEIRHNRGDCDSCWLPGEGPKRYQMLNKKWERLVRELNADALRKTGEREMADLYLADQEKTDKMHRAGRDYFFLEFQPEWSFKEMDKRSRAIREERRRKAA